MKHKTGTAQRKWRATRYNETTTYTRESYHVKKIKTRAATKRAKASRKANR